jgi:hypothetical protein
VRTCVQDQDVGAIGVDEPTGGDRVRGVGRDGCEFRPGLVPHGIQLFPVATDTDDVNTCVDQGDCRRTPESTACSGDYGGSGGHCLLQGRVLAGVSQVLIPPTWKTHRRRHHLAMS